MKNQVSRDVFLLLMTCSALTVAAITTKVVMKMVIKLAVNSKAHSGHHVKQPRSNVSVFGW